MKKYDASTMEYKKLNELLRDESGESRVDNVCGQRYIGAALSGKKITINGIPGNALGAYLNGATITVNGNAQDAVGDTMNDGEIVIHGNIGDAAGYAMRGGKIFVEGDAGYRAGIHMKEYKEKRPVMVIGGKCGSFLGEYQAGGIIIVLGLSNDDRSIVGNFPFTGMHGGKVYLRDSAESIDFPRGVTASPASKKDISDIGEYLNEYCGQFGVDIKTIMKSPFTKIEPDSKNPYKQMYVAN